MASFLKDFVSVGLTKIVMIVVGLGSSIIIARTLGPEKNGIIASLLVYPELFMIIGSLGIRQSTTFFVGKSIYTDAQVKRAITQIWFFTSLFSLTTCFILLFFTSGSTNPIVYIILVLIPLPLSLYNTYNSGFFLGKNNIGYFNRINWLPSFLTFVGVALFVSLLNFDIEGYLFSKILGPLAITLILVFKSKFWKFFSLNIEKEVIKKMLSLGLIYALALLVMNLNYRLDIIILDQLSTNYEVGIYSKGSNLIQYLWQIPMFMGTIIFARSAVSKNDIAFSKNVVQLLRLSLIAIFIALIVLVVFSEQIIVGLFGIDFIESVSVLIYLIPGVFLLTIFKVTNMDLAGKGMPWVSLKAMVPALVLNVVLNLILIPKFQADGAAIASTISYSFAGIAFLFMYSNASKLSIREIVYYKKSDFNPIIDLLQKFKK